MLYQQNLTNIQTVRSLNSVQTDYFLMFSNHNHFNCVNYRKDQFLLPRMNTDHNLWQRINCDLKKEIDSRQQTDSRLLIVSQLLSSLHPRLQTLSLITVARKPCARKREKKSGSPSSSRATLAVIECCLWDSKWMNVWSVETVHAKLCQRRTYCVE